MLGGFYTPTIQVENTEDNDGVSHPGSLQYYRDAFSRDIHIANSKINDLPDIFYKHKNMYLFYSDYLLWVIGKCIVNLEDLENRFDSHVTGRVREASPYFEISGCTDETVRLRL
jgi:hypothetical protein